MAGYLSKILGECHLLKDFGKSHLSKILENLRWPSHMVTIVENKHNIGVIHNGKLIESSGSYIIYVLGEYYCTDQITKLKALPINNVTGSIIKEYRDSDSYHIIFWHKSIYILDRSALRIMLVTTPKICDKCGTTPKICDKCEGNTPEIMFIDPDKPELLQSQRYDTQTCKVINYTREGDKFIIGGKKYRIGREIEPDVMKWGSPFIADFGGVYLCDGIYIVAYYNHLKWIPAQLYADVSRT